MHQKRKSLRRQCIARIRLTWEFEKRGGNGSALVDDKSDEGLGIHCTAPIPVGAKVTITQGSLTSEGFVRHCTKVKSGFLVGVQFCSAALENGHQTGS